MIFKLIYNFYVVFVIRFKNTTNFLTPTMILHECNIVERALIGIWHNTTISITKIINYIQVPTTSTNG